MPLAWKSIIESQIHNHLLSRSLPKPFGTMNNIKNPPKVKWQDQSTMAQNLHNAFSCNIYANKPGVFIAFLRDAYSVKSDPTF